MNVRVLSCPNCGARLRWDADAPIVECRYCHEHVVVETGRKTHLPANTVSLPAVSKAVWIYAVVGIVAVAAISISAITKQRSAASSAGDTGRKSKSADVAATPLAQTPQQLASRHGVKSNETSVVVAISDGMFDQAVFTWDKGAPEHVRWITLRPRAGADLQKMVARAREQLGRRLRAAATGGYQFNANGASFNLSSSLSVGAPSPLSKEDPHWRERLAAMWTVTKYAALGTAERIDDRVRRDVLNIGYSLSDLTLIGFDTIVGDAAREVQRVMPGAEPNGETHEIGLEHPWFETARVRWLNEAGGKLWGVILHYPVDLAFKTLVDPITACLTPVLGEPTKHINDHVTGRSTLRYAARGGLPSVDVTEQTLHVYVRSGFGEAVTAAGYHSVITTLAACGR